MMLVRPFAGEGQTPFRIAHFAQGSDKVIIDHGLRSSRISSTSRKILQFHDIPVTRDTPNLPIRTNIPNDSTFSNDHPIFTCLFCNRIINYARTS